ncbi:MAG TPA: 50S ribosomal protein L9 [Balneolales bacterium]|nr:50S ribosomal protein L9 [Balneolales bacterium]
MKLILKENVDKLGDVGEVVDVKDGYGRNYLIPQGKAVMASKGALKAIEEVKRQAEKKIELNLEAAKELAEKIAETPVTIPVTSGEEGRIHGTVTTSQIADALKEKGIEVDRRKIELNEDVKALGEYNATVNLLNDISANLKIWVVKKAES